MQQTELVSQDMSEEQILEAVRQVYAMAKDLLDRTEKLHELLKQQEDK